ncbi:MAG: prepilin peptidase [Proteobacteria bacterium]|nr:prepilin peptidase [Pseudomonadota bacterium]
MSLSLLNNISAIFLGYLVFQIAYFSSFTQTIKILSLNSWMPWRIEDRYCHVLVFLSIFLSLMSAQQLILVEYLLYLFWIFIFLSIIISDIRERKISSINLILLLVVGVLVIYFNQKDLVMTFYQIGIAIMVFIFLFLIKLAYKFFRKVDGLGIGDCFLISLISLWHGIQTTLALMIISSVVAIIYYLLFHRKKPTYPYGAFIGITSLMIPFLNFI